MQFSNVPINQPAILRTGTSNIVLPVTKASFPGPFQQGSRLTYYSSLFNTLEVNSSFYKTPLAATLLRWTHEVPDDFRFTIKMNRAITHAGQLVYDPAILQHFMQTIESLGAHKGCLLIQFPAGIKADSCRKVHALLQQVCAADARQQWKKCIEFRHSSWYTSATCDMLDALGFALVLHDMPASGISDVQTAAPFVYFRFHGIQGDYKGSYSDEILTHYATVISQCMKEGKEVYAYFNNTIGGAFANAQSLKRLLQTL